MSLFRPLSLGLYRLAAWAISPLAPAVLRERARRGKENGARLAERLGRASADRPDGPLVWLHGVSVGESLSLLPLIDRLREERPTVTLLVTTGTQTAAELVARRAPKGVIHQFAPVDTPGAVTRFLDHWRPNLGVFAESELWPNLILSARRRGVRLALVSARITERTSRGWSWDRGAARSLLRAFDVVLAQDSDSANRIVGLGGRVDGALNLKLAAPPLDADLVELARLRQNLGQRLAVIGASTHPSEESFLAASVGQMSTKPRPLLILVPRHPERGRLVANELRASGLHVALRSLGEGIDASTDAYIADTLGELGLFFRLADVVVMGGSVFGGVGGHNPLEPARLGKPVVVGSDVSNFNEVYAQLVSRGAALVASDAAQLTLVLDLLMSDAKRRECIGDSGRACAQAITGELHAAWVLLAPLIPAAMP